MNPMTDEHIPFLVALEENGDPERAGLLLAGLLTMRLVNAWERYGRAVAGDDTLAIQSAREIIAQIARPNPERDLLLSIINRVQQMVDVEPERLLPQLFTYGECLERRGDFALAVDVYQTAVDFANEADPRNAAGGARLRLGHAARKAGRLNDADRAFTEAGNLGIWSKDEHLSTNAAVGTAIVARMRGNLPASLDMLEQLYVITLHRRFRAVRFEVVNNLALTLKQLGRTARAVTLGYEAMRLASPGLERERGLLNLGIYLLELGRYEAARDALAVTEITTGFEEGRILARLNLVTVAARTADRPLFDRCDAGLAEAALAPEHRVNYLIESAKALRVFGYEGAARRRLDQAADIADHHGLNRSVFEVGTLRAPCTPAEVLETAHVEEHIRQLAATVGVA